MTEPLAGVGNGGGTPEPPQLQGRSRRVLRRALICIRHFRQELDALRSDYAEREDLPGLRTLVDAMMALVAEAEREVILKSRDYHHRLTDGEDPRKAEERFCDICGGLVTALEFALPNILELARQPHGREIEALILPFNDLLARLRREDPQSVELIFEPGDDYAFELSVLDELREIAGKFTYALEGLISDLPQLIAITYPKHLEAETLGHAIIAHEIGHTVLEYQPPGTEVAPILEAFASASSQKFQAMRKELQKVKQVNGRSVEDRASEADERTRRWFEEFACDALALGMIGPVYVFALADLDLASNRCAQIRGAAGYESHPGLRWRLLHLISLAKNDYLADENLGPALQTLSESLDALEADLPEDLDEILDTERTLIDTALNNLRRSGAVTQVLGDARLKPQDLSEEIELVWEKLEDQIPPAERIVARHDGTEDQEVLTEVPHEWSDPIRWQSILNGTYAYWLSEKPMTSQTEKHRTVPDRPRLAQDWLDFNAFVRGTIELANLQAQLVNARDRLDELNQPRRS